MKRKRDIVAKFKAKWEKQLKNATKIWRVPIIDSYLNIMDEVKSPRSGGCSGNCGGCSDDLDEGPLDLTDDELEEFEKALEKQCDCEESCEDCSCKPKCECGSSSVGGAIHAEYCPLYENN